MTERGLDEDQLLQVLREEAEDIADALDFERRHGPVHDFPDIDAELVDPKVRRQYELQEAFDNG